MTLLTRRILLASLIALALGGVSCGSGGGGIGAVSCGFGGAEYPGSPLAGTWNARFEMDSSEGLPRATTARVAEGQIIVESAAPPAGEPGSPAARPVMKGRFAIDFAPLGFTLGGTSAIAWYSAAPTLSIILHPDVDHGNIAITGIQDGDTINGQWQLLGDPMRANGRVQLTRTGRE